MLASAMFQRGAGPTEYEGCDPNVALQDEVGDIFAENILSGARASILLGKAQSAGLKLAGKFIKKLPGKSKKFCKNVARDMRRRIRKNDHWPAPTGWIAEFGIESSRRRRPRRFAFCCLLKYWRLSGNMV